LRLGINTWQHDYHDPERVLANLRSSIVMDEDAVRALVASLTDWLEQPKVREDVS
jgi:hypothetical protein